MTHPIDYLIDSPEGQRAITIHPLTITPTSGMQYATGLYQLSEGAVGLGTLTFTVNNEWNFDGITDVLSEGNVADIVAFIKSLDHSPAGIFDEEGEGNNPAANGAADPPPNVLNFTVEDNDNPVDVEVVMNYPFYDVAINGEFAAQLQQDHHSNWFVTQGKMDDSLVQSVGRLITREITGV